MKKETVRETDYPKKDLATLIPALKKMLDEYGGVATRGQLAHLFGVSEGGGGFSHIVFALKLYKVVNKEGQSDFRINELGEKVIRGEKNSTLKALMNVPVFRDLKERYSTIPKSRTAVKEYLMSPKHNIDKSRADTIAKRFIKNMKYLNTLEGAIETEVVKPDKDQQPPSDFLTYKTLVDLRASLKLEEITPEEAIGKLEKLDLPSISGNKVIESLGKVQDSNEKERSHILLTILEILLDVYSK